MSALLEVQGLSVEFDLKDGTVSRVIDGLSFDLAAAGLWASSANPAAARA